MRPAPGSSQYPAIGPWTVAYIAMRALGDRDAFPPGDVAIRRALERLGGDSRSGPLAALALLRRHASVAQPRQLRYVPAPCAPSR